MPSPGDPRAAPPAELEVALLLSGVAARRAACADRVRALLDRAGARAVVGALGELRVLGTHGPRLVELAGDAVPAPASAAIDARLSAVRPKALLLEGVTRRLSGVLEAEGLPAVPLKGTVLAETLYAEPAMRDTSDVDLLVRPEHLEPAARVIEREGYERLPARQLVGGRPLLHHVLRHRAGVLPPVELHWRVHWYEEGFGGELVQRSVPGPDGLRRLDPVALTAAMLLFYARDGFLGLRLATDLAALWDRFGAQLAPGALDDVVRRHPSLAPALATAAAVAQDVTGAPLLGLLDPERARAAVRAHARRLANWSVTGDPDQVSANLALVDGLLAPAGGLPAFARRKLVPPPPVIRDFYDLRRDQRAALALWRALHPPKALVRYALALWAVRGRRRWTPVALLP